MNLHLTDSTKLEPGRTVYVLLHKDKTHVASLPDGTADWSYNEPDMELRRKILVKDFNNLNYTTVTMGFALIEIANRQAELGILWGPVIIEMKKPRRSLEERFGLYKNAQSRLGAHPIDQDSLLRKLLKID